APKRTGSPAGRMVRVERDPKRNQRQNTSDDNVKCFEAEKRHDFTSAFLAAAAWRQKTRRSKARKRQKPTAKAASAVGRPHTAISQTPTLMPIVSNTPFMRRMAPIPIKISSPKKFPTFSAAAA